MKNDCNIKGYIKSNSDVNFNISECFQSFKQPFKLINYNIINKDCFDTKEILKYLLNKEEEDYLEINASETNSFSGVINKNNKITIKLKEYFAYKEYSLTSKIKLYLSQTNISEKLINTTEFKKADFNTTSNEIINANTIRRIVSLINDEKKANINTNIETNIWHSYQSTLSQFHFDEYENFLFVVKGVKVVYLLPNNTNILSSYNFLNINHSGFKEIEENELIENYNKKNLNRNRYINSNWNSLHKKRYYLRLKLSELRRNSVIGNINNTKNHDTIDNQISNESGKNVIRKFIIKEGEGIYIPYGWWHRVETYCHNNDNDNLAINFWWNNSNLITVLTDERGKISKKHIFKKITDDLINEKIKLLHKKYSFLYFNNSKQDYYLLYDIITNRSSIDNAIKNNSDKIKNLIKEVITQKSNRLILYIYQELEYINSEIVRLKEIKNSKQHYNNSNNINDIIKAEDYDNEDKIDSIICNLDIFWKEIENNDYRNKLFECFNTVHKLVFKLISKNLYK